AAGTATIRFAHCWVMLAATLRHPVCLPRSRRGSHSWGRYIEWTPAAGCLDPERDSQAYATTFDRALAGLRLVDPAGRQAPARVDGRPARAVLPAARDRRVQRRPDRRAVVVDARTHPADRAAAPDPGRAGAHHRPADR